VTRTMSILAAFLAGGAAGVIGLALLTVREVSSLIDRHQLLGGSDRD
jgi:hypothetical protein